jgi:hypothetical protein
MVAPGSLETRRTWSPDGSGFHQSSVAYTPTGKLRPADWLAGEPMMPVGLPGSGV